MKRSKKPTKEQLSEWCIEFWKLAKPVIDTESFQKQKEISHHHHTTVFAHVVSVARDAFLLAKQRDQKVDYPSLVRGALLHDFFLYNWRYETNRPKLHGLSHPKVALDNASKEYELNDKEKGIIISHMWPLTIFHYPKSREAKLVSYADKRQTYRDFKMKRLNKKRKQ